jgi:superfamily II DNA or RNA helicase
MQWVNGEPQSTSLSQHYARERAKVVKEASEKDIVAIKILSKVRPKDRWLVYCNSINHLNQIKERLDSQGTDCLVYHSEMTSDRQSVLNYFEREGGILLSIKCLDEGVDIPKLDRALIIASSSNPREYIQRRGRALRIAPNKYFAYLYDVIVLKSDGQPALLTDVTRAETMALNSNNMYAQVRLRELIRLWGIKNRINELETDDLEEDSSGEISEDVD